jgi:DNA polymerase III alpha subunit
LVPLHIHSYYSLLSGTASIEEIITYAAANKFKSIALTDTNSMYGLVKFAKIAAANNIKPILGAYIDDPFNPSESALFLARNFEGYSMLCKIITWRHLREDFVLKEIINSAGNDLFVIISSIALLSEIKIRENIYGGLSLTKNDRKNSRELYLYCKKKNIKYSFAQPMFFLKREDYGLHKVLTAIKHRKNVDSLAKSELVDEEYLFLSSKEINSIASTIPESLLATEYIADNCNVDLGIGKYKYPKYQLPPEETSSYDYLRKVSIANLPLRYDPVTEEARERLEFELDIIHDMHFSDYFLICWDIIKEAHSRGIFTLGRGSAAASIVSYLLGIADVDPVKYDLYFERFLNKSRSNPPDIDIDFSWKERDEMIRYVFDKYGYENVAMISTYVTFRAKSAFRETAKAFGFSEEEVSKISKQLPWTDARNLENISEKFPEAASLDLSISPWKEIIDIAVRMDNFPRHLSIHPSGIIITPRPVNNFTALEYASNKGLGLIITQLDMYGVEDMGLIKIDLLSQRSLGVLRDTLTNISRNISKKKK